MYDTRHLTRCSKTSDRLYKRCTCPVWVEGPGQWNLRSPHPEDSQLETCDRVVADHRRIRQARRNPEREDEPVTIVQVVAEYLANAKAREFADATLYKSENQLLSWCRAEGYRLLKEFDLGAAQSFSHCILLLVNRWGR